MSDQIKSIEAIRKRAKKGLNTGYNIKVPKPKPFKANLSSDRAFIASEIYYGIFRGLNKAQVKWFMDFLKVQYNAEASETFNKQTHPGFLKAAEKAKNARKRNCVLSGPIHKNCKVSEILTPEQVEGQWDSICPDNILTESESDIEKGYLCLGTDLPYYKVSKKCLIEHIESDFEAMSIKSLNPHLCQIWVVLYRRFRLARIPKYQAYRREVVKRVNKWIKKSKGPS